MQKELVALTLSAMLALGVAGCGGDDKKPAPQPADNNTKQTANVKKDDKQQKAPEKKEDPAKQHALEVMKLPEVAKYDQISKEAYPHLKWGNTGYNYKDNPKLGKDGKGALLAYGEVIAGFHRFLPSSERPTFKNKLGQDVKGDERFDIEVLVGGCKGNCVIEATSTHTKRMDPASYEKPVVEKNVLVPFDETYVRHEENGKKWVTHEKCGTK